jgi:prepilin-type N-terminal cleavage/methylation domain-containing protein/prepilin-type processing-associated H-X9-DG protein
MHRHPKAAFTLIELLVVIAIIALLAAILFPVFARVREKGRQTVCLSHLKQIGAATLMYMQDYDETFPFVLNWSGNAVGESNVGDAGKSPWVRGVTGAEPQFRLVTLVSPYVRNENVWYCPSVGPDFRWTWKNGKTMRDQGTTYGYTYRCWPWPFDPPGDDRRLTTLAGKPYSILLDPSRWPMLWDQPNGWGFTGNIADPPASEVPHSGGQNVGYGDGHAKYYRLEKADTWLLLRHSGDGVFPGQ